MVDFGKFYNISPGRIRSLSLLIIQYSIKRANLQGIILAFLLFRTYNLKIYARYFSYKHRVHSVFIGRNLLSYKTQKRRRLSSPPLLCFCLPPSFLCPASLAQVILDMHLGTHLQHARRDRRRSCIGGHEHLCTRAALSKRIGVL